MGPLTPVGGAESQDGEGQGQTGQSQGEQGAGATGHTLQHGHTAGRGERGRGEAKRGRNGEAARGNKISGIVGLTTDGAKRAEQMLRGGFKR